MTPVRSSTIASNKLLALDFQDWYNNREHGNTAYTRINHKAPVMLTKQSQPHILLKKTVNTFFHPKETVSLSKQLASTLQNIASVIKEPFLKSTREPIESNIPTADKHFTT
jgi:hypothetical protein